MTLRKLPLLAAALAALLLVTAACSDSDEPDADDNGGGADTPASSAVGPGISIAEAFDSTLDGPLLVNGTLVIRNDEVRLCEALAESFPPQCGGASLLVVGADITALRALWELKDAEGTTWSEGPIQLLGTVEGEALTIVEGVSG